MIVIYDTAHSGRRTGAQTANGTTEKEVAHRASKSLRSRIESEGWEVFSFTGSLRRNIRKENEKIRAAQDEGISAVAVSLHFNQTPLEPCPICKRERHMGGVCQCGARSTVRWKFGHKAIVGRGNLNALSLADAIFDEIEELIPWSPRQSLIKIPDPAYHERAWPNNLIWPSSIFYPAILVEIGFASDPRFAKWIDNTINQFAYGMAVGEAVVRWGKAMKAAGVPLEDWRK